MEDFVIKIVEKKTIFSKNIMDQWLLFYISERFLSMKINNLRKWKKLSNYFNRLLPFSMHFLCHTVMNFCERDGEITFVPYFFQENVLSERKNFCSCYYNFPLLYVREEWSKSRNISQLAKSFQRCSSIYLVLKILILL